MNKTIQQNVVNYFSCLDNHVNRWNENLEKLKRPMVGLKNQAEQLTHVEKVVLKEELCFPNLKENLTYKILCGIDDELIMFKNTIHELNSLNQLLRNKLMAFEKSTNDFDWYNDDEKSGSALQPRLSTLLQMAYESWKCYSDLYQNIASAYKLLNVRNTTSLKKLEDSLKINEDVCKRINYILGLTQYCNKNSI